MPTLVNNLRAIRGPVTAVPVTAGSGIEIAADTQNNQIVISSNLEAGSGIEIVDDNGKAKIINSDNAQALPIVAGTGVKLSVVNNQVVVSADETVLWTNPGPQTNTKDITWSSQSLSESIANFEKVKFIYSTDQSGYAPLELTFLVRSTDDSYVLRDIFASSSMWLLRIAIFELNGTSITNTYNVTRNMSIPTNGGSISCSGDSTGYNILYKIVGINRIANN